MQALEDSELVHLDYASMQKLYTQFPETQYFGRVIAENLFIELSNRKNSLMMESPEERYSNLLKIKPTLFQRVPQYLIESYLVVTPEALSRIRKRLSKF